MITSLRRCRNESLRAGRRRLIIALVVRRLHVPKLIAGEVPLDAAQLRHARDVLRLGEGAKVQVFDDLGAVASGTLLFSGRRNAAVRVEKIEAPRSDATRLTIASAVPKGERADWMVEKLSELGVFAFVPLAAARSVVLPQGTAKRQRWVRIATEAAKQSRRLGVMQVGELMPLQRVLSESVRVGKLPLVLSTSAEAMPIARAMLSLAHASELIVFVGPEGGWTTEEQSAFQDAGAVGARLTGTILRIETAAVAAAAVVQSLL